MSGDEGESIGDAVGGVEYEIDFEDDNASEFHAALDCCIAHSRWPGGGEGCSFRGIVRICRPSVMPIDPALHVWGIGDGSSGAD
ncbi:Lsr2 family protein [Rhodococcus opacus]|nr:Lsr2 family protein [Rhodococcus opacus]MDJ0419635.1 Lsr2 family protein [Rhodococcus opacus]WKN52572.1 Lsr2 family protein [Rhodococcus opacus]